MNRDLPNLSESPEKLETFFRRVEVSLADLVRQRDQLMLIAEAVPAPIYDEDSGEPRNFAAELELGCRLAREGLEEPQRILARLLDRFPAFDFSSRVAVVP